MFHSIVEIDDTRGGRLHVGFVSCFGEPAVQWAFVDAEGQLRANDPRQPEVRLT